MAAAVLSIKLRCGSWQQLATIYRRDLSKGAMFLKASSQPPIGALVHIDLEMPSATVIELAGVIVKHVVDAQRGTGVELKLEPLPTKSVWLIESALAAESKVRAATSSGVPAAPAAAPSSGPTRAVTDGVDIATAEQDLVSALEAEAESLRKLNPFLVLGVGYETTDDAVRAAFGELTKRYHPDRFARYQSAKLREIASEIFILIRDAYRKLADEAGRAQVVVALGAKPTPPRPTAPTRPVAGERRVTTVMPRIAVPPVPPVPAKPAKPSPHDTPTKQGAHDAPTNPSPRTAEIAGTELARSDDLAIPIAQPEAKSGPVRAVQDIKSGPVRAVQDIKSGPIARAPVVIPDEADSLDALIEDGKLDEALAGYRALSKRQPQDRASRAGIELCEGLKSLAQRDRLEAAQRFEAALDLDPSNERAARELADMRRQATNERKGLLSRLMGKKEPPP